jgi:hypothetical protein
MLEMKAIEHVRKVRIGEPAQVTVGMRVGPAISTNHFLCGQILSKWDSNDQVAPREPLKLDETCLVLRSR